MSLLEEVRFHGSYSFKYSDRPGTRSADFSDKIDEKTKSERLQRFQSRQDEISLERNKSYVDKIFPVMIEKNEGDSMVGRTGTNHLVHFSDLSRGIKPGDFIQARIIHAGHHSLQGKLYVEDED